MFAENVLGYIMGDFFANSSGHPASNACISVHATLVCATGYLTATTTQPSFSANEKLQKTKMSFC
jgi:fluoride ion exporter CrcB/FEX